MRILHVTDVYLPRLGGIETHVSGLAQRQADRGDEVTVVTTTPSSYGGAEARDDGPVQVRRVSGASDLTGAELRGYDAVHTHLSVFSPLATGVAGRAALVGTPTVVTVHSLWEGTGPLAPVSAAFLGLWRAPVFWTAVSRLAADQVSAQFPGGPRVGVLPNAVDVPARSSTPARAGSVADPVRLVSTMRMVRRKRPHPLVAMLAELHGSADVPVHLTIIGDGPRRPGVERAVRRRGLGSQVRITGRVAPAEVLDLLRGGDVYVAPAARESFGLAALEARCLGLPVVGRADSGMTEFIRHGREGLLATSDAEMVDQLRTLVSDPAARVAMAERNRTTPTEMTWEHALTLGDRAYAEAPSVRRARRVPVRPR